MSKFAQIAAARPKPGKIVPLVLNMLPGSPTVHVEHLGETNAAYWQDAIARAEAEPAAVGRRGITELRARRERNRGLLVKFAVRRLEAVHSDGTPATDADIPEFVEALPDDVVDTVWVFCSDVENFRERPLAAPEKLAGK